MSMRKHIAFASMCMGLFIAQLDIQIVSSSLNEIGGGLSAGKDEMAWLQTSYLIAEIIVIPLSGWLSRVFSTRWLFTLSAGNDSNLLIVFYVQIMPDDLVMQLHRF